MGKHKRDARARRCISAPLRQALEDCGLPWRVENGSKHKKLYVADKLIGVISNSFNSAYSKDANHISKIRRMCKDDRSSEAHGSTGEDRT